MSSLCLILCNKYNLIKIQMSMFTISKLLKQLEEPDHNPFDLTTVLSPDFGQLENQLNEDHGVFKSLDYFANRSVLSQRQSGSFSWEEIIEQDTISQSGQIQKIYSTICGRIVKAKYGQVKSSVIHEEETDQLKNQYLGLKSLAFHRLYLPQSALNDVVTDSRRGFEVDRLKQFCEQMREIEVKLLQIVNGISEEHRWLIKLQGLYLLYQISQLIRQLVKAAYPFVEQSKIIKIITIPIPIQSLQYSKIQKQITVEQNELRLADLRRRKEMQLFMCQRQDYLESGLRIVRSKMQQLEQEKRQNPVEAQMNDDFGLRHLNGMSQESIGMNKMQSVELMFRLQLYVSRNYDFEESNFMVVFNQLLRQDPTIYFTNKQIKAIAVCYEYQPLNAQMYINFHYKLIHKLKGVNLEMNLQNWKPLLKQFLILLGKSLTLCKYEKSVLLQYENYFELIKLIKAQGLELGVDDGFVRGHFQEYLVLLNKRIGIEVFKVKMEMRRVDESFTYKLLVNNKIIEHLLEYQHLIHSSLSKIVPILLLSTKIKVVREIVEQQKLPDLFEVIQRFQYISLLNQKSLQSLMKKQSRGRQKQKEKNLLDKVLQICRQNPQLVQQMPHILQFRHILILFEVLKTKKRKTRKNQQSSYIDFKYLQQIAYYFSGDRKCGVYQLKSKILLFVTLFKMGHYIPKIRDGVEVVNLRQRIINLMIKQAQNNSSLYLATSIINKDSLGSSVIVYNNQSNVIDRISTIMNAQQSQVVQIKASKELSENIGQYIKDVSSKEDRNWVDFITQRMNVLEHELFLQEKKFIKMQEEYLTQQYLDHIKNCLRERKSLQAIHVREFECFICIQRYFFLQKYEKGWELLHTQKQSNNLFDMFMDKLIGSTNGSVQAFKFLKIYKHFNKIQAMITPRLSQSKEFLRKQQTKKIIQTLKQITFIDLQQQAIEALILFHFKNKRIKDLEAMVKNQAALQQNIFQNSINMTNSTFIPEERKNKVQDSPKKGFTIDSKDISFLGTKTIKPVEILHPQAQKHETNNILNNNSFVKEVRRFQKFEGISVTEKIEEESILQSIKIGKMYSKYYKDIQEQLRYFTIVIKKGISRIKSVTYESGSKWKQNLVINIEQSKYSIQNNIFCSQRENLQQKMTKAFLDRLVELLKILLMNQESINIDFDQREVSFDFKQKTVSINPYFIIIQKIMDKLTKSQSKSINLFDSIDKIISPFRSKFSKQFDYNYTVLLTNLKSSQFFTIKNISTVHQNALFLSLSEKAQIILDFQQRMGSIYRKFNLLANYPKNSVLLLKKRMQLMLDLLVKNYTYNFKIGGVVQRQAIQEQVCRIYEQKDSPAIFVWYDQKVGSDDLFDLQDLKNRQYRFSFQQFMRKLKRAIVDSYEKQKVMIKILQRFPKLIQFLRKRVKLITEPYKASIESKNSWLYRTLSDTSLRQRIKQVIASRPELADKMKRYEMHFSENILKLFNKNNLQILYSCTKCQSIFKVIQAMNKNEKFFIIDLLHEIARLFPKVGPGQVEFCGLLTDEHNAIKCFLNDKLMVHPGVAILGKQMTKPLPKYFLTVNWWFYIEYSYPLLVDILSEAYSCVLSNRN